MIGSTDTRKMSKQILYQDKISCYTLDLFSVFICDDHLLLRLILEKMMFYI